MKLPEPVAAQHRFRHPQKTMPNWSVWQPTAVEDRPPHEIDSMGYQVEYRTLYSEAKVKELLAQADKDFSDGMVVTHLHVADQMKKRYESVLKQALEALEYANPLMECYWGNNASETIAAIKKVLG